MSFEPDIVVAAPGEVGPTVVIEVKQHARREALSVAEANLRAYMLGMGASVGMLVTPGHVRMFRDMFRSREPSSIELVCDADLPELKPRSDDAMAFESDVQGWLETLRIESVRVALPTEVRTALETHLLPLIEEGVVRAAGPRFRSAS